jgi:hypothetical protein
MKQYSIKFYDSRRYMFSHKLCKSQEEADEVFLSTAPKLEKLGGVATMEEVVNAQS